MAEALARNGGRAEAGDGSFEAIYRALSGRVFGLCLKMLGDRPMAAEAAADVFVKVREHLPEYDRSRPLEKWVLAIAGNHCLNVLRRRGRERAIFEPSADESGPVEGVSAEPGALARLLEHEEHAALHRALESLPPRHRTALLLRYAGEQSYDDIARELRTTRTNVGVLLFRAKALLREALAAQEGSR